MYIIVILIAILQKDEIEKRMTEIRVKSARFNLFWYSMKLIRCASFNVIFILES